jgi:hypothetical protein
MNHKLKIILGEVASIQLGLLRFRNADGPQNLQVKIAGNPDDYYLHCAITGEIVADINKGDKRIHVIQKNHNNYFFISGSLSGAIPDNSRVFSVAVHKASWFEKKRRGKMTWLREKYTYENEEMKMETITSSPFENILST